MQGLSSVPRMTGSSGTSSFWFQSTGTMMPPPCAVTFQTGRNHFQIFYTFASAMVFEREFEVQVGF